MEEELSRALGQKIRQILKNHEVQISDLQEIRLRIGKPLMIVDKEGEKVFPDVMEPGDLQETLEYVSRYSLHAYENELKEGYITIEGGHRVGISGQVWMEKGEVKKIRHVSTMNIRISHEMIDCANHIFPYITQNKQVCSTLIISPPGCGKTTLLRDLVRQVSDGNRYVKGRTVGVVDERSEIGGCYLGVPQNQLGIRTDVLDGCPKSRGMLMLIRSMSPQVIAVDEIGGEGDVQALQYAMHCGCRMLATVHGTSLEEIRRKPFLEGLISRGGFERYVVLGNSKKVGEVKRIYNEEGSILYGGEAIWQN